MDTRVIQVASTHPKSQGDYVRIEASQFDPAKHELFAGNPPDLNTVAFAAERDIKLSHGKDVSKEDRKTADDLYKQQQADLKAAREKQAEDEQGARDREAIRNADKREPVDPGALGKAEQPASAIVTPPTPGGAVAPDKVLHPVSGEAVTPKTAAAAWDTGSAGKKK